MITGGMELIIGLRGMRETGGTLLVISGIIKDGLEIGMAGAGNQMRGVIDPRTSLMAIKRGTTLILPLGQASNRTVGGSVLCSVGNITPTSRYHLVPIK